MRQRADDDELASLFSYDATRAAERRALPRADNWGARIHFEKVRGPHARVSAGSPQIAGRVPARDGELDKAALPRGGRHRCAALSHCDNEPT